MGFCPQLGGVGPCPAQCIWQGSGFAADQTNAILAVVRADDESLVPPQAAGLALSVARPLPTETASLGFGESPAVGGDKSSRKRKPLHLLEITAYAEEFSICGREMKCFFIRFSRGYFPCTQCFFGTSMWGWYHYPRRALHAVETLDACGSRRRIRRFYAAAVLAMCGQNIPSAGTHSTPAPNRAYSGSHAETWRVLRVDGDDVLGSGIIDTIDPFQADQTVAVALAEGHRNAVSP